MRAARQVVGVLACGAVLVGCGSSSSGGDVIHVAAQPPSSAQAIESTKANLRNLATAEESYLTDYYDPATNTGYTTDSSGLATEGFSRQPDTEGDTLVVGVDGYQGYCLIGSPQAGDVWVLYDSAHGGVQDSSYPDQADAERACSDPKITDFEPITITAVTTPDTTQEQQSPPPLSPETADTYANLRNLAVSEEVYLTDFGVYTTRSQALAQSGFTREPGSDAVVLLAGIDGQVGYCLVGGATADGPWYLYDSRASGLQTQAFEQESATEAACFDPKITDYATIS